MNIPPFRGACLLILIYLAFVPIAHSQKWQEGYVVTTEDDTLHGYVKKWWPYTTPRSSALVEFRLERRGPSEFYEPGDLHAYQRGGDLYLSGLSREFYAFLKVEEIGRLRLLRYSGINHLYSPRQRFSPVFNRYYLSRQTQPRHLKKVSKETFRLEMSRFFRDTPELSTQIRDRQLRYRDINEIVEEYNRR
jgi:hypothetical protein